MICGRRFSQFEPYRNGPAYVLAGPNSLTQFGEEMGDELFVSKF